MAKMIRRTCAFCPEDEECAIMYIAKEQNIAAHQECLLYSSGFMEAEEYNHDSVDTRFDLASVLSEIKRGKRLICNFCRKKGATVGCEIKTCRRSYHYFCALCDDAAVEKDEIKGIYRMFCPNHDPVKKNNFSDEEDKRVLKKSSAARNKMSKQDTSEDNLKVLREKQAQHKAKEIEATKKDDMISACSCSLVRIDFVRKCKQAGLLDGIFEEMLDTLHLAQEKLMDDNTSEAEYEETVISLFDCGIFENILAAVHSGTEEKIQELINTRKQLDAQIKLLKDLNEVILPTQEHTANGSNSL